MNDVEEVDPETGQPKPRVQRRPLSPPPPPAPVKEAPRPPPTTPQPQGSRYAVPLPEAPAAPAARPPSPPAPPVPPMQPPQQWVAPSSAPGFAQPQHAPGPQPQSYVGGYPYAYPYYYPPPYPYGYGQPFAPRKIEPRRLRTARAFDTGVFSLLLLGSGFAWSALVAAVAAAALFPTLSGDTTLGTTESSWLGGVMAVRVVVWLVFSVGFLAIAYSVFRFHDGRAEFGPGHERAYRDLQAAAALFVALVGGAGIVTFILSNPGEPRFPAPPNSLYALKSSILLSAVIWGAAAGLAGLYLGVAVTRLLRGFLPEESHKKLAIVPVFFLFIPLLHTALTAAFLTLIEPGNTTWSSSAVHASAEVGGLAGALAAIPLIVLVRGFREAHERIASGAVKPVSLDAPA